MTTIEDVQTAIRHFYGLSIGEERQRSLTTAVKDIGRDSDIPEQEVMSRALTDGNLLREIAGRITIPESFFFRHPEQLEILADFVRTRLLENESNATVQIWSAGCSQGEEPLSLAILLKEILPPNQLKRVVIFGSDISKSTIAAAHKGIYSPWSFRGISEERKLAYFTMLDERSYRIRPEIHSMVTFQHCSIQEQLSKLSPESIDVILFRNVAIYLAEEILDPLCDRLCSVMKAGGLLCISNSDPPIRYPGMEKLDDPCLSIYRKRVEPMCHTPSSAQRLKAPTTTPLVFFEMLASRSSIPLRESPSECDNEHRTSDLFATRNEENLDMINESHFLSGQMSLAADNHAQAEEHFRKAMFTDPSNPLIRFWYAVTLFEGKAYRRASAQMTALTTELNKLDAHQLLNDGKTTAVELLHSVRLFQRKMEKNK